MPGELKHKWPQATHVTFDVRPMTHPKLPWIKLYVKFSSQSCSFWVGVGVVHKTQKRFNDAAGGGVQDWAGQLVSPSYIRCLKVGLGLAGSFSKHAEQDETLILSVCCSMTVIIVLHFSCFLVIIVLHFSRDFCFNFPD